MYIINSKIIQLSLKRKIYFFQLFAIRNNEFLENFLSLYRSNSTKQKLNET